MAQQDSWSTIDFESANAVDPDYMFPYGTINGMGVNMVELHPVILKTREERRGATAGRRAA